MEVTKRIIYDVEKSASRIDEILDASNSNYADKTYIPSRDSLTYTTGYYVNVTSLFIDMMCISVCGLAFSLANTFQCNI